MRPVNNLKKFCISIKIQKRIVMKLAKHLDDILPLDIILFRIEGDGLSVFLAALQRLWPHGHHFTVHVQNLDRRKRSKDHLNEQSAKRSMVNYLEIFTLQTNDNSDCLGIQLHQISPLVLAHRVDSGCHVGAQLQIARKHL